MGDAPDRICVVNCGLSGMDCACFRAMYANQSLRADLPATYAQIMAHPKVQALVCETQKLIEKVVNNDGMPVSTLGVSAALAALEPDKFTLNEGES